MEYSTPTNEWNREARRAAEVMAEFRNVSTDEDEDGFMIVIGDQLGSASPIFIGWCREGELGKTLELVQFGSPLMLAVLAWPPAMISDVSGHLKALAKFQTRTDADNWFWKMPQVEAYLDQVRNGVYGNAQAEAGIEGIKSAPAAKLLSPVKKTQKKRRKSKRTSKKRHR